MIFTRDVPKVPLGHIILSKDKLLLLFDIGQESYNPELLDEEEGNIGMFICRKTRMTVACSTVLILAMNITASSVYIQHGNQAEHAFDRDSETFFSTNTEHNPWIRCDLGQQVQLAGVMFMAREGSYSGINKIYSWVVSYQDSVRCSLSALDVVILYMVYVKLVLPVL